MRVGKERSEKFIIYVYIYVCIYVYIYVCIYVYMYLHMYEQYIPELRIEIFYKYSKSLAKLTHCN